MTSLKRIPHYDPVLQITTFTFYWPKGVSTIQIAGCDLRRIVVGIPKQDIRLLPGMVVTIHGGLRVRIIGYESWSDSVTLCEARESWWWFRATYLIRSWGKWVNARLLMTGQIWGFIPYKLGQIPSWSNILPRWFKWLTRWGRRARF